LGNKGFLVVLAAGNSRIDAKNFSPARANGRNIYTVSAHDINDNFASFSNFGNPPIDYCAPGVSVYSTYKNGSYATMSGTSMAAPHVAGILLANNKVVFIRGTVKSDPDYVPDRLASRTPR
jgi:subtilisin family serine protease